MFSVECTNSLWLHFYSTSWEHFLNIPCAPNCIFATCMVPYSVANEAKMLGPPFPVWRSSWETQTENKTWTRYLSCHLLHAACHFTLIEKCPSQLTLCAPLSSPSQLSAKQNASRKIQRPGCLCVCIYFSYLNARQALLHTVPTGLSALITDQKPQNPLSRKEKMKQTRLLLSVVISLSVIEDVINHLLWPPDMFPDTSEGSTKLYRLAAQQLSLSIIHSPHSTGGVGSCLAR